MKLVWFVSGLFFAALDLYFDNIEYYISMWACYIIANLKEE